MMRRLPAFSMIAALWACTAFAALSLLGCSADDNGMAGESLPEGKYPLTFSTAVKGLSVTRATADNTWEGNETVAVRVDGVVKKYNPASSGTSTTLQAAETPFYWQASDETKKVSAWCTGTGYVNEVPMEISVIPDQRGEGYQASDFLYAPETSISFADRNTASLTFYHQTAKVVINILNADAVTDAAQITRVSLVNMSTKGRYAAPQGGNTAGTWTTVSTPEENVIIPKTLAAAPGNPDNILQSYTALVIPQDMADKKFIKVTANGNDYYYTPSTSDATLQSGKQHTYNITVKNNYLEVVTVSDQGGAWSNDGIMEQIQSKPLAVGDFYMKDGSVIPGSTETLTEEQKANCIGVVFWVGDATAKDKTLKADHPNCTHGLVVALKDAIDTGEGTTEWQNPRISVQEWLNTNRLGNFLTVLGGFGVSDPLNNIQGYNNTKAIEAFNEANQSNLVLPVNAVLTYRNNVPAPNNSSNWYLPSIKELTLLYGSDVPDIWKNQYYVGTETYDLLNGKNGNPGQFDKLGSYTANNESAEYWSSTEGNELSTFFVDFTDDSFALSSFFKDNNFFRVRCILAF